MTAAHDQAEKASAAGPRWDPLIRMTHWGVAAAVLVNGLVNEGGSNWHIWIGYGVVALLALRLIWGFIGTEEARFASFPLSIHAARTHVSDMLAGRRRQYRSHNPLGSLMVYALWAMLLVVTATGIGMAGSPLRSIPFNGGVSYLSLHEAEETDDDDRDKGGEENEFLEELHEISANLLLLLAALHIAGVALESRLSGRNLLKPMISGKHQE